MDRPLLQDTTISRTKPAVTLEGISKSFPGVRAPYDFGQYDLRGRYFRVGFDVRF